ncbi:carboxypeptidase regulatory-like domain-containing protein [Methanomethylophilus alvi]|uniref:carboxypeptidase regulatory-like domain-containing protein n=1 Tax=Methanomethylophilus alvi TaxID=1291540 RepID=UPI0037DD6487
MRKFAIGKAAPDDGEPKSSANSGSKGVWFREHWRLLSMFAIIIAAFLMRFVFAYGISAGDNYALSGGSSASNNLRIVEEILAGTYSPVRDAALNYPFGSANTFGPLFDYIIAAIAFVVTLFGVSDATAAAGVLAWSAPILGALTCIPVYMAAKKMFKGDETIGIVAALFYAFFALLIMTTPFSNGTGFAFICFVAAWMVYFLASAFEAVDRDSVAGPKGVFHNKSALRYTVLAGIFFAAVVLSWTDFRMYVIVAAVCLAIAMIVQRIGGRDMWSAALIVDTVLAIGLVLGACYYIPVGLWDAVFSGGFVLGLLTIAFSIAFAAVEKKPWVVTIPVFIVAIAVVAIAFALGLPEISNAMTHGNSVYNGSLMQSLVNSASRTSISGMASYYGWLTLWFPLIYGGWMLYRYRKHSNSRMYGFTMLFLLSMFFVGWFNADYAVLAGAAFAIGCSALSVRIIRSVDMKGYFASLRGNGVKAGARKALKFFPFSTLLVAVLLVVLPNAVYAVDAATPTNDEKSGYYGGLGYTINTAEDSMIDSLWNEYSDVDKSGSLVTWMGNANDSVIKGGFKSVTDAVGGGASAMTSVYLSDSSAKVVATFALRIMLSADLENFRADIAAAGLDYAEMERLTTGSGAKDYIAANSDDFSGIDIPALTDENAVYLAVTDYIVKTVSEDKIQEMYSSVCVSAKHYNGIKYVEVDGSMLPIYYNDSSSFTTMAYLGNYATGSYGAVSEFYSINSSTGYTSYTNAMYQTFLWKALLGIDGSGYGSSMTFLQSLALADKSVTVTPAATLDGFKAVYWHVMYNPDSSATSSSDGWVDMDAYEAIAKQKTDGGLINYISSVVLLEYVGNNASAHTDLSGTVIDGTGAVKGVKVAVFEYDSQLGKYVQRSTAYTDGDGKYTVAVPNGPDYYVTFYVGATNAYDGTAVDTRVKASFESDRDLALTAVAVEGTTVLSSDNSLYKFEGYLVYTGVASGKSYQVAVSNGSISEVHMVPDIYNVTLYLADGTSVTTAKVTVSSAIDSLRISVPTGTVTVTVTDEYGAKVSGTEASVYNVDTGEVFKGTTDSAGSAKIVVPAGTYGAQDAGVGYAISSTSTVSVSSGGSKTISLTAYPAKDMAITNNSTGSAPTISSIGYMSVASTDVLAHVPAPGGVANTYTAYVISDGKIYYGVGTYSGIALGEGKTVYSVTGTVKDVDGKAASGVTVTFIRGDDGAVFSCTTNGDGQYTAYVPSGTYTLYSYNGDGQADLRTLEVAGNISADSEGGNISLRVAYSVSQTVNFHTGTSSSSTKTLPFYGLSGKIADGETSYNLYVLTNTSGKAVFWVPKDGSIEVTMSAMDAVLLKVLNDKTNSSTGVTSNTSLSTMSFELTEDAEKPLQVKKIGVTNSTEYDLKIYYYTDEDSETPTYFELQKNNGNSIQLFAGKYYLVVDELLNQGYYADDNLTVYLGHNNLTLDSLTNGFECYAVEVKYTDGDSLSITALKDSDGNTGTYEKGDKSTSDTTVTVKYYLEKNHEYIFSVKSGEDKVAVSQKITSSISAVDLTSPYETVKVSGYVGVTADGSMTVRYTYNTVDYELGVDIKDGNYEFNVPKNVTVSMSVNKITVESNNIKYELKTDADESVTVEDKDVTYNFSVISNGVGSTYDDAVEVVSGSFDTAGNGTLEIKVFNTNKYSMTYVITGSSVFVLDKAYTLTIAGESNGTVTVKGHFDATKIGAGDSNMYVTVSDIVGNEVAKCIVPANKYAAASTVNDTVVNVTSADKTSSDIAAGSVYRYAITIVNPNSNLEYANVTASLSDSSVTGWKVFVVDSTGYIIYAGDSTEKFDLNGFSTTTLYVMVINTDGSSTAVPKVKVDVTVTDVAGNAVSLKTDSSEITVSGNVASAAALEAQTADLSLDSGSVSDGGASNEGKKISMTFWALFILTVLVLLLIIWTGSKRGVFSRK